MNSLSLYDILLGQFPSESKNIDEINFAELDDLAEEQKLRSSIVENLRMVLSARQGSVQHLPDFGMPDILKLYFDSNNSIEPVKKELRNVILKYEPRIADLQIEQYDFDPKSMRITLRIVALIKDISDKEILLTEFSTTGWTKVIFERDRE